VLEALKGSDLQQMPQEQLVALVLQLRGIVDAQKDELVRVRDERDAALLLNELCHY
jgi:hypothetical protein